MLGCLLLLNGIIGLAGSMYLLLSVTGNPVCAQQGETPAAIGKASDQHGADTEPSARASSSAKRELVPLPDLAEAAPILHWHHAHSPEQPDILCRTRLIMLAAYAVMVMLISASMIAEVLDLIVFGPRRLERRIKSREDYRLWHKKALRLKRMATIDAGRECDEYCKAPEKDGG